MAIEGKARRKGADRVVSLCNGAMPREVAAVRL